MHSLYIASPREKKKLEILKQMEIKRSHDSPSSQVAIVIDRRALEFLLDLHPAKVSFNAKYIIDPVG